MKPGQEIADPSNGDDNIEAHKSGREVRSVAAVSRNGNTYWATAYAILHQVTIIRGGRALVIDKWYPEFIGS
jgi:hypothetical protein